MRFHELFPDSIRKSQERIAALEPAKQTNNTPPINRHHIRVSELEDELSCDVVISIFHDQSRVDSGQVVVDVR